MKKTLRVLALVLVMAMALSALAGCSGNTPPSGSGGSSPAPTTGGAAATGGNVEGGTSANMPYAGTHLVLFSPWANIEKEQYLSDKLEEDTGMTLSIVNCAWNERATKLTVMLSGGEQVDVTARSTPADMSILCDAGALLPINEHLENSTVYTKENWTGWDLMDAMVYAGDGLYYGLPMRTVQGYIYTINKAWLDELNLEVPTTTEELTEVLRAFKEADLGGNGSTIPIAHQFPNSDHIATFLGMWGIEGPYIMVDEADGLRYHPWLTEEGLAGLQWMQDMYKEGLLDPEFASENGTAIFDKVKAGMVGVFLDWPGNNRGYNLTAQETGANVNFIPMSIPQAIEGVEPVNCGNTIINNNLVVNTVNEDAAWSFIEWLGSDEGTKDWTWTEGENYNIVDGEYEIEWTQLHANGYSTEQSLSKSWNESGLAYPASDEVLEGYDIFYENWAFPPVMAGAGDAEEIALPMATQVIVGQMTVEDFATQLHDELMSRGLIDK